MSVMTIDSERRGELTMETRRKPAPEGFAEMFLRWGWRGVETAYGSRTSCNKRWVGECGGPSLIAERRQYRQRLREVRAM